MCDSLEEGLSGWLFGDWSGGVFMSVSRQIQSRFTGPYQLIGR
jgi:hypothetical protein